MKGAVKTGAKAECVWIACPSCHEPLGCVKAETMLQDATVYSMGLITGHLLRGCSQLGRLQFVKEEGGQ